MATPTSRTTMAARSSLSPIAEVDTAVPLQPPTATSTGPDPMPIPAAKTPPHLVRTRALVEKCHNTVRPYLQPYRHPPPRMPRLTREVLSPGLPPVNRVMTMIDCRGPRAMTRSANDRADRRAPAQHLQQDSLLPSLHLSHQTPPQQSKQLALPFLSPHEFPMHLLRG
jgi:hypothetical protein